MILKAKERGDGKQLGIYLLRTDTNEHVEVHEVRGFASDDPVAALHEIDAISSGTRAKNYLFSMNLNPPPKERVPIEVFETAIESAEQRLGLAGQPRMVVFHEKDGRRHAHAVWSRIDTQEMKAINLPHYKLKLRDLSKEIFLEQGWQLPRGFVSWKERDPATMSREEWQQAERLKHHPKVLKRMFQECWAASDSANAFKQALKERGYALAIGDSRGFVAVDYRGKPYSVARYTGQRTNDVKARLGNPIDNETDKNSPWPSLEKARKQVADRMTAALRRHVTEAERAHKRRSATLTFQRSQVIQRQRDEREKLRRRQEERWNAETRARAQRLSKGFRGIWDRITGKHAKIRSRNEREALLAFYRDREEKDRMIFTQIEERRRLQERIREEKAKHGLEVQRLHRDVANYRELKTGKSALTKEHGRAAGTPRNKRTRERDCGPELE